ncbi:uncharacterized protein LOC111518877 [Drosophila willistoni]|uniref:uncharacterized protein LOC111518877 n=1 Tax=Drosophila willistoni TaxID=7260 RepID=UPI001F0757DD|nr:uncharacterized protein LOC111518877 [Drosophila willistoni]
MDNLEVALSLSIIMPIGTSLWLQLLLQVNVYLTAIWSLGLTLWMIMNIESNLNSEGFVKMLAYLVALAIDSRRLYVGYIFNLRASVFSTRALPLILWLTTPQLVLVPLGLYLSSWPEPFWLPYVLYANGICMALEVLVTLSAFGRK